MKDRNKTKGRAHLAKTLPSNQKGFSRSHWQSLEVISAICPQVNEPPKGGWSITTSELAARTRARFDFSHVAEQTPSYIRRVECEKDVRAMQILHHDF